MKKIKILYVATIIMAVMYIIGYLTTFVVLSRASANNVYTGKDLVFGSYNMYISDAQSLLIFIGLIVSILSLKSIIKEGYFSINAKKLMSIAGYIFFFSGVLMTVLDIIRVQSGGDPNIMMGIILMDFMFALLGFIVLIIADMAQTGYQLKSENDLTI
ncbi:Protein of unknown function (DUF2975) [Dokdonia sp. Hel_I_63]|uniref:DUF2975 domain-containing protein n=1 Tax=unclassified Dokdonia TaxID=2615033 RepID=UPI00020A6470|nr:MULTISPECIES: DUF2975 domain-containing protein [unclassified Dokdonia]AEE18908.1 hypothetical protein Krodi_0924 [Dokdonia sp. 4H-3-7-5]TVZ21865.1 Protein of unknown function (DUF2975) [Dokdonia sp. Hel_I_63]